MKHIAGDVTGGAVTGVKHIAGDWFFRRETNRAAAVSYPAGAGGVATGVAVGPVGVVVGSKTGVTEIALQS